MQRRVRVQLGANGVRRLGRIGKSGEDQTQFVRIGRNIPDRINSCNIGLGRALCHGNLVIFDVQPPCCNGPQIGGQPEKGQ